MRTNQRLRTFALTSLAAAAALALAPAQAATVTWSSAANGFWDAAGNWNLGLPANGDDVVINLASAVTASFRTGTLSLATVTIGNASSFAMTGGTLSVAGAFTQTGSGTNSFSGGTLRPNGVSSMQNLSMTGGTLGGSGALTVGTLSWSGGTMGEIGTGSGSTTVTGLTTLDGTDSNYLYYGRTLSLNGNTSWTAGNGSIYVYSGGQGTSTLNIGSGTTFTDAGTDTPTGTRYIGYYNDGVINNAGTYLRNGQGTTSMNTGVFNNTGTVTVSAGRLDMGAGSSTGTFNVAAGATLGFSGGVFNVNSGTLSNAGTLTVGSSGTLNIAAGTTYSGAGSISVTGGLLNSATGSTISPGALSVSGGTARFAGTVNAGPLTMTGGVIGGTGTLTATTLDWSGGTMGENGGGGGVTTITGTATLDGTDGNYLYYGRTLNLNGNTTWTAGTGQIYVYSGGQGTSTLNIGAGTTFTDAGTGAGSPTGTRYIGYYNDGVINNAGTYLRNGQGTTSMNTGVFNNTGTVTVSAGQLDVGAGSSSGTFNVAAGATLGFSGGVFNLNGGTLSNAGTLTVGSSGTLNIAAGTTFGGSGNITVSSGLLNSALGSTISPGSLQVSGGTARFAGPVSTGAITLTGGVIGGAGTVTTTTLNWSGGQMGDSVASGGTTTVTGASTLDGTDSNYLYYGRTLNLNGDATWTAGTGGIYVYSAGQGTSTLNIAAGRTFTDAGVGTTTGTRYIGYYGDGVVNNAGTYVRNGLGTTSFNSGVFNNTGTVTLNSGTLDLGPGSSSGTFNVAAGTTAVFSQGTFTITGGTLANAGTVRLSSGVLHIAIAPTVSGSGVFEMTGGTLRTGAGGFTVGRLNFTDGRMGENAVANGSTTVTGTTTFDGTRSQQIYYGHTLNLGGDASWTAGAGSIAVYGASQGTSRLNIGSGTTFTDAGAGTTTGTKYIGFYGDGVTTNAGTYVRNGLGTTTFGGGVLDNTGTVTVNAGTLQMGPGSSTGTFNIAAGATAQFSQGTFDLNSGSIANAGTLRITNGTVRVASPLNVTGSGTLRVDGGTLRMLAGSSMSPANVVFEGGTISGPGTINAGTLVWNGATFGESGPQVGTFNVSGTATIDGAQSNYLYYGSVLNLNGATSWTAGNGGIYVYGAGQGTSRLNIGSGATFTDAGAGTTTGTKYIGYYGDGVVSNAGTFVRNGLGTTSFNSGVFDNTGTVTVNAGTLDMGPGSSTGTFNVAAGATAQFSQGTFDLNSGSIANAGTLRITSGTVRVASPLNVTGSGTLRVDGGTLRMLAGSSMSPANVVFEGGTISGPGTINAGTLAWNGATFGESGPQVGTFNVSGNATIDGAQSNYLYYGSVLNLNGATSWTAGNGGIYVYGANQGTSRLNIGSGATFTDAGAGTTTGTKYIGYYSDGVTTNAGTYVRNGLGTTSFNSGVFTNTGTVTVNAGTLDMGPGSSSGTFNIAAGATAQFSQGTFDLNSGSIANAGTMRITSGTVRVASPLNVTGSGTLRVDGGTLRMLAGSSMSPANVVFEGGTISGPGTINAGTLVWNGATFGESGPVVGTFNVSGNATIDGTQSNNVYYGSVLNLNGATSWTAGNGGIYVYGANQGTSRLNIGSGATFTDAGAGTTTGTKYIGYYGDGATTNAGTFVRNGLGTTSFNSGVFDNTGTVTVNAGTLQMGPGSSTGTFNVAAGATAQFSQGTFDLNAGSIANAGTVRVTSGTVRVASPLNVTGDGALRVDGGTLRMLAGSSMSPANVVFNNGTISGPGTINAGTLAWNGAFFGENAVAGGTFNVSGNATIDGTQTNYLYYGHTLNLNGNTTWTAGNGSLQVNGLSQGTSRLNIGAGATFTDAGSTSALSTKSIVGATDGITTNAGTYVRNGLGTTQANRFVNTGTVIVNAGTINFSSPLTGSGTLQISAAGTALFSTGSANHQTGVLDHQGTGAASLNLGSNTLTVSADYNNANWGSGNTFNRRANIAVTGTGNKIIAAGDANQGVTGAGVTGGTSTTPTLTIGNVHVGSTTIAYGIANTGTTGPALRGAIQTTVGGAAITDARLSGNGVTAGNWGPVATGTSLQRDVVFTVTTAGAYTALAGQSVNIVNNFDNTRSQRLIINSAAGAAAYNLASANTLGDINFGVVHVGDVVQQALTITNTAPTGAFTESLNASFGGTTSARLLTSGQITGLAAGSTNGSAMVIGLDTSTAGSMNGFVTVNFASNGDGTSGLGLTALPSQTIGVPGTLGTQVLIYRYAGASSATPNPVNLGNARVGGTAGQLLTLSNTAANDGFSERLNATIGGATTGITASGSFNLLAAQGTDSTSLRVGLDTSSAGAKSGTATISLASDGSGTSGLGVTTLASQTVAVNGNVFRLATAGAIPNVTLANQRVGGTLSQSLLLTNTAAADGFSESLNATIAASSPITTSGSVSLLAAGASSSALAVGVNTATAGLKTGDATITLQSDGAGTSGFGALGIGTRNVTVTGGVYLTAQPTFNTTTVNLGNVHVGSSAQQALTVGNVQVAPAGYQEGLGATGNGAAAGGVFASGSVANLAAGGGTGALVVGIDTSTAGNKGGNASFALSSVGAGTSGLATIALPTQQVAVSGTVYRFAAPSTITPVNFGNVHVGDVVQQALVIGNTAAADGFSESLNASFGSASTTRITTSGSITGLAAGGSSNTMVVGLDTSTAGAVNGSVVVNFASNGAGTSGLGITNLASQNVSVGALAANVYRYAAPSVAAPNPVNFGNVRIGSVATQALTVNNTAVADGFSERLNASLGGATGGITASGSFSGLAAGAGNSTSLVVTLDTSSAGTKSGTATLSLVSDGSGTSGLGQTALGTQAIAANGAVYRLANPVLNTASVTLAARVGDSAPSASIGLTNASPDAFTERLNATAGAAPAGFTTSGSVSGLAAGGSSSAIGVTLNTATSGSYGGNLSLGLVSSGAGTTGAADQALTSQQVALSGKVYAPAVAQVNTASVDFGIVHRNELVAGRTLSVTNAAGVTGANDVLVVSFSSASGPFAGSGGVNGLAAGSTDAAGLTVNLDTSTTGVFNGNVAVASTSRNPDLADLSLGTTSITATATVNDFAAVGLSKTGGGGTFSRVGNIVTLDFGSLVEGTVVDASSLLVFNAAVGQADLLSGGFDASGLTGTPFSLAGGSFSGLVAGGSGAAFSVGFSTAGLGTFQSSFVLNALGSNASGYSGALADTEFVLRGNVVAVPEPSTYAMLGAGLALLAAAARRRRAA